MCINESSRFLKITFLTACLLSASNAALADDWEIYTGNSTISGTVKPNIVLLMDTSSSMRDSNVNLPLTDYDPNFQYPEKDINGTVCRSDVVYFIESHNNSRSVPYEVFAEITDSPGCGTDNWIPVEALTCQASLETLNKKGYFYDTYMAQYDKDESSPDWEDPTGSKDFDAWVECKADAGVHGRTGENASITWTRKDEDGNDVLDEDGNTIFEPLVHVPDMATGDDRTYLDAADGVNDTAHPWVTASSLYRYTDTTWESGTSYAESDMLLIHPNYMRYLFTQGDHDNDGTTADVRFAELINKKRIEVLQEVMTELLTEWNGIRVSIIRYNDHHGSSVTLPALDIDCEDSDSNCDPSPNDGVTNRELMISEINKYWVDLNGDGDSSDAGEDDRVSGGTPHTEAIYEAYNYLRGGPVEWGYVRRSSSSSKDYLLTNRAATWEGRGFEADGLDEHTYLSPIQYDCQSNFIVHMTDGGSSWDGGLEPSSYYYLDTETSGREPTMLMNDNSGKTDDVDIAIKSLPEFDTLTDHSCNFDPDNDVWSGIDGDPADSTIVGDWDSCADELTEYMANIPQPVTVITSEGDKVTIPKPKPIKSYVIGFGEDSEFLNAMGEKGLGGYFTAIERGDLREAFDLAITNILNSGTATISAPGVAVESFSRARHLDDLYFNIFQYNSKPLYDGNLKKFKLAVDADGNPFIQDEDEQDVVQSDGSFSADSRSYWSASADGNNVTAGGAASNLPTTRNIYTWITGHPVALNDSSNLVHETNEASIPSDGTGLNLPALESTDLPAAEALVIKQKYLKFARGLDAMNPDPALSGLPRMQMGDPLHSIPIINIYDANESDLSNPDAVVYTMTNEGYLHAINMRDGYEEWAYIPQELLKNIRQSALNSGSPTKIYGLDGFITLDQDMSNGDGHILETVNDDYAHIYFGMRRGGRNYYSLDVTERSTPSRRWDIIGGSGDFDRLGETWSRMYLGKVLVGTQEKKVLFFTGGYDSGTYDEKPKVLDDAAMGNAIYMVDAETGNILWTADDQNRVSTPTGAEDYDHFDDMDHAFPGDPAVVDMNSDGYMDRIYAVDIAGQLWRFDIHNGATGNDFVTGAKILETEGAAGSEKRHFFNQPDVVVVNDRKRGRFTAINFGSGNRDKPGNTEVGNMFFSFRDPNPAVATTTSYELTKDIGALKNVTTFPDDNPLTPANEAEEFVDEIYALQGWYFGLPNIGEKNLSAAVTVNGEILFTSYQPPTTTTAIGCQVNLGTARLYTVSVKSGAATQQKYDVNPNELDTDEDRSTNIAYQGIPPGVVVLFPMATGGDALGLVGTSLVDPDIPNRLRRAYWYIKNREPGK